MNSTTPILWTRRAAALLGLGAVVFAFMDPMWAWQPAVGALVLALNPRAAIRVLALATFVLLLVGGAVTTYRVGMAVHDWPTTFGEGMFAYPLDEMLASGFGVSLEHSHRLFASLVGLVTLCVFVLTLVHPAGNGLRALAFASLVAVSLQGVLGGTRVLENSQHLAFLHGAFAQVFYGLVAALFVRSSKAWRRAEQRPCKRARSLRRTAALALPLVFAQIVLGAWLRHSGAPLALMLHVVGALVSTSVVVLLARELRRAFEDGQRGGHDRAPLRAVRHWLLSVLGAQVVLGILATAAIFMWSGGFAGRVSSGEAITATLHVGVGALLLGGTVAALLWSRQLVSVPSTRRVEGSEPESVHRGLEPA